MIFACKSFAATWHYNEIDDKEIMRNTSFFVCLYIPALKVENE